MAMAIAMAGKQKNKFWRELRDKGGWCCFWWSVYVYAPCAMGVLYGHMGTDPLYNPKLPIWPLIGLPDLAGDQKVGPSCN